MLAIGLITEDAAFSTEVTSALDDSGVTLAATAGPVDAGELSSEVVVVDAGDGADALERVAAARTALPERRLVACLERADPRTVRRLIREGAAGVVWRDRIAEVLAPTLRAVAVGQLALPIESSGQIAPPDLTTREKQVLSLVVMGLSNGEIARKLFLTESTVKTHLGASFRKLGVKNRAEAAHAIADPDGGLGTGILAISGPALSGYKKPASD